MCTDLKHYSNFIQILADYVIYSNLFLAHGITSSGDGDATDYWITLNEMCHLFNYSILSALSIAQCTRYDINTHVTWQNDNKG